MIGHRRVRYYELVSSAEAGALAGCAVVFSAGAKGMITVSCVCLIILCSHTCTTNDYMYRQFAVIVG